MIALTSFLIVLNAYLFTRFLTPWIGRVNSKNGRVDKPGGRKNQQEAIPYGGGLAVFFGFAGPVSLGIIAASMAWENTPDLWAQHAPGIRSKAFAMATILTGAALMLLMGRVDDKRGLSVVLRFGIQILAAGLVAMAGVRVTLFLDDPSWQIALTIAWIVFITNACNFIDNMDGLLCGTALVSASTLAIIAAFSGQLFVCAFALALAGALLGFLPFNRAPARVYLGDEGSMFIGFLLACLATLLTYSTDHGGNHITLRPFLSPLLCLLVPVADGLFVISCRIARGRAPWRAGLDHLSHGLEKSGRSRSGVVSFLWSISLIGGALALILQSENQPSWILGASFLVGAAFFWRRGQPE